MSKRLLGSLRPDGDAARSGRAAELLTTFDSQPTDDEGPSTGGSPSSPLPGEPGHGGGMRVLVCLVLALSVLLTTPAQAAPRGSGTYSGSRAAPSREGDWPLQPRPDIAAGFDPPATRWGPGHRGVDLLGQVGQQVHTSLGGVVRFAAQLAGRGVVVVDHGALRTTYEPVTASVRVGEVTDRGAVIGTLQRSSSHCFPRACLHWGLLHGATYLDPLTLVGAGPVRLLPLIPSSGLPAPEAPTQAEVTPGADRDAYSRTLTSSRPDGPRAAGPPPPWAPPWVGHGGGPTRRAL